METGYTHQDLDREAKGAATEWLAENFNADVYKRPAKPRKVRWILRLGAKGGPYLAVWFKDTRGFEHRTQIAI